MSLRTSATRYARALLDVAIAQSNPEKVEQDLAAFVALATGHRDLKQALANPAVPPPARRSVVESIAQKSGAEPPVVKLLALLAERGRLELLPELLAVYRERLLAHRNIVRASVTSATPLAEDAVAALQRSLGNVTGKQVQIDLSVDPSLIGGVITRIGSTVYDGSVRTQLQRMKQQLVEHA